jgi:hypothetical protein
MRSDLAFFGVCGVRQVQQGQGRAEVSVPIVVSSLRSRAVNQTHDCGMRDPPPPPPPPLLFCLPLLFVSPGRFMFVRGGV